MTNWASPTNATSQRARPAIIRALATATLVASTSIGLLVAVAPAEAAPDLAACQKLKTEHNTLEKQGVADDLKKDPAWAKANLPQARVDAILRYLTVHEQLEFRCENVFAAADAVLARREAEKLARARALANIPPPPVRRPKPSAVSRAPAKVTIPLPTARPGRKPGKASSAGKRTDTTGSRPTGTLRTHPTGTKKAHSVSTLWETKTVDRSN